MNHADASHFDNLHHTILLCMCYSFKQVSSSQSQENILGSQVCWHITIILELGKLRQEIMSLRPAWATQ
jgi:hypothetical protein